MEEQGEKKPSGYAVSEAFAVPAMAINRFIVVKTDMGARIAFGERVAGTNIDVYRAAIVLTRQDVVQLSRLLAEFARQA